MQGFWEKKRPEQALGGALVCVALLLGGCGGGGGGGASGGGAQPQTPPVAAPRFEADFYPLSTGDRRSWRVVDSVQGTSVRHERVGEAVGAALVLRELTLRKFGSNAKAPDEETLLERTGTALIERPGPNADALSRAVGPVELLRFGLSLGQRVRLVERTVSADVDGDGRQDSLDLRIDSEFVAIESVSTAAGSFGDAHKVRSVVALTLRLAAANQAVLFEQTSDEWYARGVGPVRSTLSSRSGNDTPTTSTEELIAFKVGDRRSEQAAPAVGVTTPVNDGLAHPEAAITLKFNRPIDPLSLSGEAGLRLLRDGSPVDLSALQMPDDAQSLRVDTRDRRLPDGRYELRHASQACDWAGNLLPDVLLRFVVDTQGPRQIASSPHAGAQQVARKGRIEFRFDEPLHQPAGSVVSIWLRAEAGNDEDGYVETGEEWLSPAVVSGHTVAADLPIELRINSSYSAGVNGRLTDVHGNEFSPSAIRFRTEPGPLSRPEAWWPEAADVAVTAADLNGDGRADLLGIGQLIGSSDGRVVVRMQRSSGGFEPLRALFSAPNIGGETPMAVADMNGDGRLDIALPESLLVQRADGGFGTEPLPKLDPTGYWTGRALRLAGGGSALVWYGSTGLSLWQRESADRWRLSAAQPANAGLTFVEVADVDGDGRQDLIGLASNATQEGWVLAWSLQSADGSWSAVRTAQLPPFEIIESLLAADLNQDRRSDIVVAGRTSSEFPQVVVMRANATGGFDLVQQMDYRGNQGAMAAADLDGDGRVDLVMAEEYARTGVLLQSTDGQLSAPRRFEAGRGATDRRKAVAVLDINGDGRSDIVQGNAVLYGRPTEGRWPPGLSHQPLQAKSRMGVLRALRPQVPAKR